LGKSYLERSLEWGARDSARRAKERARRERQERQREERQAQQRSAWTPAGSQPPDVGVIDGTDHIVSFKTGGPQGDRTIIADGDYSDDRDGFDMHHNDYGSRREAPGEYFAEDRGYYSGPYH
jgi:hypothetical protein